MQLKDILKSQRNAERVVVDANYRKRNNLSIQFESDKLVSQTFDPSPPNPPRFEGSRSPVNIKQALMRTPAAASGHQRPITMNEDYQSHPALKKVMTSDRGNPLQKNTSIEPARDRKYLEQVQLSAKIQNGRNRHMRNQSMVVRNEIGGEMKDADGLRYGSQDRKMILQESLSRDNKLDQLGDGPNWTLRGNYKRKPMQILDGKRPNPNDPNSMEYMPSVK